MMMISTTFEILILCINDSQERSPSISSAMVPYPPSCSVLHPKAQSSFLLLILCTFTSGAVTAIFGTALT